MTHVARAQHSEQRAQILLRVFILVQWRPRTADWLSDFSEPKLEPFLEP